MKRLVILAAALAAALPLAACDVRVDTPDPTPEPPSAAEVIRQREALRSEVIADVGFSEGRRAADHASVHLELLGGVWEAWPDGDGPEDAPARDIADVSAPTNAEELAELLELSAADLDMLAIDADDAETALLFGSIAIARSAEATRLRVELGSATASEWPELLVTSQPSVIRELDAAGYRLEALAAQDAASGSDSLARTDAARFRAWAESSVETLGIAGTADDPRETHYDVASLERADIYAQVAAALVTAIPSSADRATAITAARASATQAVLLGATFGALPGTAILGG